MQKTAVLTEKVFLGVGKRAEKIKIKDKRKKTKGKRQKTKGKGQKFGEINRDTFPFVQLCVVLRDPLWY
jgi:hypothetical protein